MKSYFKITLLAFFSFFVLSCATLRKQETKDEINKVASTIVDVSIDVAVFKVKDKLKPIEIPIFEDTLNHIYIDKFGFVKLDKLEANDSLQITFTPSWITIRDTAIVESLKFLKTQNDLVEALVFQSLNYAVIKASEKLKPLTIKLKRADWSFFLTKSYVSPNKIILVELCPDNKCVKISIDAYEFGEVLKKLSRERLFKQV
jgi:hypothetical protein